MRKLIVFAVLAVGPLAATGCGDAAPTISTLSGSVAQGTFPAAVTRITIVDDKGSHATSTVAANGGFRLDLNERATYRFFLGDDGASIPLVVRSDDGGRLETELHVVTGGAFVDVGSVRYHAVSFAEMQSAAPVTSAPTCADGVLEGTTEPCASGTAALVCADVEEGDDDDDHEHQWEGENDPEDASGSADPQADETALDANPGEPMAIPTLNAPEDLRCGEEHDDEEEGDD